MRYIEKINNVMAEGYTLNIPIKDLERIDYWLTLLKESANRMYDSMKKIKPTSAIIENEKKSPQNRF